MRCKRCGSSNTYNVKGKQRERWITECVDCGFWYRNGSDLYTLKNRRVVLQQFFDCSINGGTFFLDVGCGLGIDVLNAARRGGFSVGIDVDRESVEYSHRKAKLRGLQRRSCFVLADGEHIPFRNQIFDVVVCFDVIEHLHRPSRMVKEVLRVSKKNVVLATPTDRSFFYTVYYRLLKIDRAHEEEGWHVQWFNQKKLLAFLGKCGSIQKVYGLYNLPMPPFALEHSRFKNFFERFDRLLGQTIVKTFAYTTITILNVKEKRVQT